MTARVAAAGSVNGSAVGSVVAGGMAGVVVGSGAFAVVDVDGAVVGGVGLVVSGDVATGAVVGAAGTVVAADSLPLQAARRHSAAASFAELSDRGFTDAKLLSHARRQHGDESPMPLFCHERVKFVHDPVN